LPAIVIVAVRELVDGLAVAEKATVPEPLPDAPAVIVNQLAELPADQEQPEDVVTPTDPEPEPAASETAVVESA
jgi:hypothetical protein